MNVQRTGVAAASLWRGDILENSHQVHLAVVDQAQPLLYSLGDPDRLTLARSAAKPAQALAILASGAFSRFDLTDADLALMCGSHSSETLHVERARAMLAQVGAVEADLRCGAHPSLSDAVQRDWIARQFQPTALCSNCSGKHVGMLAAQRALGFGDAEYHRADHPLQAFVRQSVAASFDLPASAVHWAVDGCNLPTPALPLRDLARFYGRLAHAATLVPSVNPGTAGGSGAEGPGADAPGAATPGADAPAETGHQARVYHAMAQYPHLIAGTGRFCSALIATGKGELIGKVGADASYAIGVRASARTAALGAQGSIGLSVKIEDGNVPVLHAVVVALLEHLGLLGPEELKALAAFRAGPVRNTMGVETGRLTVSLPALPVRTAGNHGA